MNARNTVWVEKIDGRIVRIFRGTHGVNFTQALAEDRVFTCPRLDAVREIWDTIFTRSAGKCEYCSHPITRSGWTKGEMHEEVPRGTGGEISVFNSKMICRDCHRNDPRGHANRKLHFSGKNE